MSSEPSRRAGHVYVELISAQLVEERAAKTSLDQRGAGVVTWAGGLVAASLALLQTIPKHNGVAAGAVLLAAALLTAAAIVGALVIRPADYQEAKLAKLREIVGNKDYMGADEQVGLARAAENALDILEAARATNEGKAGRLRLALGLLAAGTGGLALAVAAIVCRALLR